MASRNEYWSKARAYAEKFDVPVQEVRREAGFKAWYNDYSKLVNKASGSTKSNLTDNEKQRLDDLLDDIDLDIEYESYYDEDTP